MAKYAIINSANIVVQIVEATSATVLSSLELLTIYGGSGASSVLVSPDTARVGIGLKWDGTNFIDA